MPLNYITINSLKMMGRVVMMMLELVFDGIVITLSNDGDCIQDDDDDTKD